MSDEIQKFTLEVNLEVKKGPTPEMTAMRLVDIQGAFLPQPTEEQIFFMLFTAMDELTQAIVKNDGASAVKNKNLIKRFADFIEYSRTEKEFLLEKDFPLDS